MRHLLARRSGMKLLASSRDALARCLGVGSMPSGVMCLGRPSKRTRRIVTRIALRTVLSRASAPSSWGGATPTPQPRNPLSAHCSLVRTRCSVVLGFSSSGNDGTISVRYTLRTSAPTCSSTGTCTSFTDYSRITLKGSANINMQPPSRRFEASPSPTMMTPSVTSASNVIG